MLKTSAIYRIPKGNYMRIKCAHCGREFRVDKSEVVFDWECVGTSYDDRDMGAEHEFESTDAIVCPKCLGRISVKFSMWEYPEGIFNTSDFEIKSEEGILMKGMDISDEINFDRSDFGVCEDCGEYKQLDEESGLCPDCLHKRWKETLSDR